MAVKVGKVASVRLGTYKIAGMGQWGLSGFTREVLDDTEFGDDIKSFVFGIGDAGEVSFEGNYDPADTTGQALLNSACENASAFSGGTVGLVFYIDNTSYWSVTTGGQILVTKATAVTMEKSGLGRISFTGKVSGGKMVLQ